MKYNWYNQLGDRPDTLWRQGQQLPPCLLIIALVPLKCSSRNLQFPQRVPFTKEKMPWSPCPFKNEAYMHVKVKISLVGSEKEPMLLTQHFDQYALIVFRRKQSEDDPNTPPARSTIFFCTQSKMKCS